MTYPPHALVALGGTLPGDQASDEIFQFGVRIYDDGGGGFIASPETWLNDHAPAIDAWWKTSASLCRADATLKFIKCNNIAGNGRYNEKVTHVREFNDPGGATVSSNYMVSFVCVAWSWTTSAQRGLAHTGRVYPPNTWSVGGTSPDVIGNAAAHVTAAKGLLTAISGGGSGAPGRPCVVSGIGAGLVRPITGVRVGDVIDVQRRRKNDAQEHYTASTWP